MTWARSLHPKEKRELGRCMASVSAGQCSRKPKVVVYWNPWNPEVELCRQHAGTRNVVREVAE